MSKQKVGWILWTLFEKNSTTIRSLTLCVWLVLVFLCSKENPMRRVDMFESISQIEFQSFFQYIRKPRKKKKAVLMIDIFPAGADMQVVCIRRTIQYLLVDCNQTGHWKEKKIMIENFKSLKTIYWDALHLSKVVLSQSVPSFFVGVV